MKNYYLIIFILTSLLPGSLSSSAQIVNPDFEFWIPNNKPAPGDWEEPEEWTSTNALTDFSKAGCRKSNIRQSGLHAVVLQTAHIAGEFIPGVLCNGKPMKIYSDYALFVMSGGTPIEGKPISLSGYYSYDNPNDSAYAVVILKKFNGVSIDTVSMGTMSFPPDTVIKPFTIKLNDLKAGVMPDSILIVFYSSNPSRPRAHSSGKMGFLIDDLSLSHSANVTQTERPRLKPYPNPGDGLFVVHSAPNAPVEVFDCMGRQIHSSRIDATGLLDLRNLGSGVFFLKIASGGTVSYSKIVIH